jgi:hypothetical protein
MMRRFLVPIVWLGSVCRSAAGTVRAADCPDHQIHRPARPCEHRTAGVSEMNAAALSPFVCAKALLLVFSLLVVSSPVHGAEGKPDLSRWKEDFSDEAAFLKNWSSYGWLADGKVVGGSENMHRWWQIHDGTLQGQTFGRLHPSGLTRKISGRDVRVSLRFKLEEGGMAAVGFNGPNPILEANFHLAGVNAG